MEIETNQQTNFEGKRNNTFLVEFNLPDGIEIPSFSVNKISKPKFKFNYATWDNMKITFFDPICPSTSQQLFKLINVIRNSTHPILFNLYIKTLGPVGDIVEEWEIQVKNIVTIDFGDLDYTSDDFQHPYMIITPANCNLK